MKKLKRNQLLINLSKTLRKILKIMMISGERTLLMMKLRILTRNTT